MERNGAAIHHPAPWVLEGSGYILLFSFPQRFAREKGFIPDHMLASFRGGLGTVMYVDYRSSDAGPYQELLFIPGRFDFSGRRYYSITRIYVSTQDSVEGGRANWGIPKELASFEKSREGRDTERIRVYAQGVQIADLLFRSYRWGLPVTTVFMPPGLRTLAHPRGGQTLLTTIRSRGVVGPARLLECNIDGRHFPPIHEIRPLCTVRVPRFTMTFPRAEIL